MTNPTTMTPTNTITPETDRAYNLPGTLHVRIERLREIANKFETSAHYIGKYNLKLETELNAARLDAANLLKAYNDCNESWRKAEEEITEWQGRYNGMSALVDQQQQRASLAEASLATSQENERLLQKACDDLEDTIKQQEASLEKVREEMIELCNLIKEGGTIGECKQEVISAREAFKKANELLEQMQDTEGDGIVFCGKCGARK